MCICVPLLVLLLLGGQQQARVVCLRIAFALDMVYGGVSWAGLH